MDELEALRRDYARGLPDKIDQIEHLWEHLARSGPAPDAIEHFHHAVHKLAGTGTVYGFPDIGEAARELDSVVKEMRTAPCRLDESLRDEIDTLVTDLRQALRDVT